MLEQVDHANIVVDDLEKMVDFYHRVLGFAVTKRVTISGPWVSATVGLHDAIGDVVYLELPAGPRVELIRYVQPKGLTPQGADPARNRSLQHPRPAPSGLPRQRYRRGRRQTAGRRCSTAQ
jgi:catechol 2,3-dioxygenase-like lactoylglutathione lyase family enzyme